MTQQRSAHLPALLTRQEALALARAAYGRLVGRVLEVPNVDRHYVEALEATWERHLEHLSSFRSDATIRDDSLAAFLFLTEQALEAGADDLEAMIQWLDGYPDAVSALFPPSALTFGLVPDKPSIASAPVRTTVGVAAA